MFEILGTYDFCKKISKELLKEFLMKFLDESLKKKNQRKNSQNNPWKESLEKFPKLPQELSSVGVIPQTVPNRSPKKISPKNPVEILGEMTERMSRQIFGELLGKVVDGIQSLGKYPKI